MKKVYLAKSNRSNPDDVQKVRKILNDSNCETVEYTGGSYSHAPLLDFDVLVVIPDLTNFEDENLVGKGLYGQVEAFIETDKPIYVVFNTEDGWDPEIGEVADMEIADYDDYFEFGNIYLEPLSERLSTVMDETFGEKDIESTGGKRRSKYLLLAK